MCVGCVCSVGQQAVGLPGLPGLPVQTLLLLGSLTVSRRGVGFNLVPFRLLVPVTGDWEEGR